MEGIQNMYYFNVAVYAARLSVTARYNASSKGEITCAIGYYWH